MKPLAYALLVVISSVARAGNIPGPFAFEGWMDDSVYMQYQVLPKAFSQYVFPSYLSVTGNDALGTMTINRWDFYDEAKLNAFYSLPPQTFSLTPSLDGASYFQDFLGTPNHPWRVRLRKRIAGPNTADWRIVAIFPEDTFVNQSLITDFPWYTKFEFQFAETISPIPEPTSILWAVGSAIAIPLLTRRNRRN